MRDGEWFSYAFLMDQFDAQKRFIGWSFGGFQGGEGSDSAGGWYVENVLDELDYATEVICVFI